MTTVERAEDAVRPEPVTATRRGRRPVFAGNWWRYLVSLAAIAFAVFPVLYVVSAAFNPIPSLTSAQLIPDDITLDNFERILSGNPGEAGTEQEALDVPYVNWYLNTVIVAGATAVISVLMGALAAYAFARFRFHGRRFGLMSLLLIQMFPTFLAVVAIYYIVLNVGEVFPAMGLDTRTGVILVYLGGALGVNTWLMKGFFDSIPSELDESARVDGATPAQVFWGVILPLAAPVLALVGLFSFIGVINEFVIASVILQNQDQFTLALGLRNFIDQQYSEHWGAFAAGVVLAAPPVVLIFLFLQKFIVSGLTGGAVKG